MLTDVVSASTPSLLHCLYPTHVAVATMMILRCEVDLKSLNGGAHGG